MEQNINLLFNIAQIYYNKQKHNIVKKYSRINAKTGTKHYYSGDTPK